jgi:hypothetical protein
VVVLLYIAVVFFLFRSGWKSEGGVLSIVHCVLYARFSRNLGWKYCVAQCGGMKDLRRSNPATCSLLQLDCLPVCLHVLSSS